MADSGITKRALAASLKNLMTQRPFTKISVGDICAKCDMNRKSFYYHFRDKYDLVNWIFEHEFVVVSKTKSYKTVAESFEDVCVYLYSNREFYREALRIEGQNSFSECFTQFCSRCFTSKLEMRCDDQELKELQSRMLVTSLKNAITLWLSDKDCPTGERFAEMFISGVKGIAELICNSAGKM